MIMYILSWSIIGYIQVAQLQVCVVISQAISDAWSNRISGRADPAQVTPPLHRSLVSFPSSILLSFPPFSAEKWQLGPARYAELLNFSNVVQANRGEREDARCQKHSDIHRGKKMCLVATILVPFVNHNFHLQFLNQSGHQFKLYYAKGLLI